MEPILVATTAADLEKVTWLIHDCYFDLDQLRWDAASQTLEMDFGRGVEWNSGGLFGGTSSKSPSLFSCTLVVRGVRSHRIEDEAMIGVYDLYGITYDAERREVVVESNVPCVLRLQVETLHVEVRAPAVLPVGEGGLSWYTDGVDVRAWLEQAT